MSGLNDGSMDLPYEPQADTPLTDDFWMCGGLVVMAAKIDTDLDGVAGDPRPALAFRFALADGSGFLPPILLCVEDRQMRDLSDLIGKASKDAIRSAKGGR